MNISAYARTIELKKFAAIHENIIYEQAPTQAQVVTDGFTTLMNSKPWLGNTSKSMIDTWSAIQKLVVTKVNANIFKGDITFPDNPALGNLSNLQINWIVDETTGNVTFANGHSTNPKFEEFSRKIIDACIGAGTNEEQIESVFHAIQNQQEFDEFKKYFDNLGIKYQGDNFGKLVGWNSYTLDKLKQDKTGKPVEGGLLDDYLIGELDSTELDTINSILMGKNISYTFKESQA